MLFRLTTYVWGFVTLHKVFRPLRTFWTHNHFTQKEVERWGRYDTLSLWINSNLYVKRVPSPLGPLHPSPVYLLSPLYRLRNLHSVDRDDVLTRHFYTKLVFESLVPSWSNVNTVRDLPRSTNRVFTYELGLNRSYLVCRVKRLFI